MADTPTSHEFEAFVPRRYLRNRHAMTLAGNFLPRQNLFIGHEAFGIMRDLGVFD